MFAQYFRVHRASANKAKSARIAHGAGKPPAAGPYHPGLDDGIFYIEKLSDFIHHLNKVLLFYQLT
jgi:hypothetical protein